MESTILVILQVSTLSHHPLLKGSFRRDPWFAEMIRVCGLGFKLFPAGERFRPGFRAKFRP